jgi:transcriptional regulator with XRE-family HTH domain
MARPDKVLDPLDVAVGVRLRALRNDRGMTQTQLGAALGVTFQQVQKYERGTNRISTSALVRAAAALGAFVAELVGEALPAGLSGEALGLVNRSSARDLLTAYAALERAEDRSLIIRLAEALGRGEPDWGLHGDS